MADTTSRRPRPPPTDFDLADRLVAIQRKSAGAARRGERERSAASTAATAATAQPAADPQPGSTPISHPHHLSSSSSPPPPPPPRRRQQHDIYDRRLPDPSSTTTAPPSTNPDMLAYHRPPTQGTRQLFNPNTDDPIPRRPQQLAPPPPSHHLHRDVDGDSDVSSQPARSTSRKRSAANLSSSSPSQPPPLPSSSQVPRQLFDPRRDDPYRFTAVHNQHQHQRVIPKAPPSGGYISASATSASDAQSLGSNLTLTSGTTSSSASNPYSPAHSRGGELGGQRLWLDQMKRMYREISQLEAKIVGEGDVVADEDMYALTSRSSTVPAASTAASDEKWARLVREHQALVDLYHGFLSFALKPQVPASLQTLPVKYNIPARLWNHGFQRLLQSLRRASISSTVALEQLGSFIIFAYGFYTSLLEEENLVQFRVLWLEALGDLARYQMAVVSHLAAQQQSNGSSTSTSTPNLLTLPAVATFAAQQRANSPGVSRMEESPLPSIGIHALAEFEIESDRELWRRTAREWYTKGIRDTPGQGRLHHHLGLVSADEDGAELRAVYHFAKSLVTTHTIAEHTKEDILSLFSIDKQNSRYQPSSSATDIFLLMQGMLFTRIQLDDFQPSIARFKERLQLNPAEVTEAEWIMMGVLNICALLEYGKSDGVLRRICGWSGSSGPAGVAAAGGASRPGSSRLRRQDEDETMEDVAANMEALSTKPQPEELPYTMQLALQLTMEILQYAMAHPSIPSGSPFRPHALNPYLTTVFTFLATVFRQDAAVVLMERFVPWAAIAQFFTTVRQQTTSSSFRGEDDSRSASASKWFGNNPLPEDLCLRGSEWVRRVYERGFWRSTDACEMDVLVAARTFSEEDMMDGVVEGEHEEIFLLSVNWTEGRWKRLRWAMEISLKSVNGLAWTGPGGQVVLQGALEAKVAMWEQERREEEERERKRRERVWRMDDERMDVEEDEQDDEAEDEVDDSPEVRELKARRRYLRSLLAAPTPSPPRRSRQYRQPAARRRPPLNVVPGYTILVCDTNILLSSLPQVSNLITSLKWTVVIPLAVITELDGLSHQADSTELGAAAKEALTYLVEGVSKFGASLKVQTSRGNYLPSLSVRSEELPEFERTMDDVIVKAALWQQDHFFDRSALLQVQDLKASAREKEAASKVVLLTFDRNMRLKARSKKLDAADEKDMAVIFSRV